MGAKRAAAKADAGSAKRLKTAIHESMDELLCPITHALPLDPVTAEDGIIYERQAVERWLKEHQRSPSTNLPMGTKIVPAPQIKNMIERMVKSKALPDSMASDWKQRIKDQAKVKCVREAAESGDADAATKLGEWYAKGKHGLDQNRALSHTWHLQAAESAHIPRSMVAIADDFYHGRGVAAFERGMGGNTLANLYERGLVGLPVDLKQVFQLRKSAYESGE